MVRIVHLIVLLILPLFVQAQTFEKDWAWLHFVENTAGKGSRTYQMQLINIARSYNDSTYCAYYDSLAMRLCDITKSIKKQFGVTSDEFYGLIDAINAIYSQSLRAGIKLTAKKHLNQFMESLEKDYPRSGVNGYIFSCGLSDYYYNTNNYKKALKWGQKRVELAKDTNDRIEIAGAYAVLIDIFEKFGKNKDSNRLIENIIDDNDIYIVDKKNILCYRLNRDYFSVDKAILKRAIKSLLSSKDCSYSIIDSFLYSIISNKDYQLLQEVEQSEFFKNKLSVDDKFNYYNISSILLFDNDSLSVSYLEQATSFAIENGRNDLNWHFHGSKATEKTHNFLWIGFSYEILNQKDKAIEFYEKNLEEIVKFYGKRSSIYLKELQKLTTKYSLWFNNSDKVLKNDSVAVAIALDLYGKKSNEYKSAFHSYITALKNINAYSKIIILCDDYIKNSEEIDSCLPSIYNQQAMAFSSMGQYISAFAAYTKALELCNDESIKNTIIGNIALTLADRGLQREAVSFIEKNSNIKNKSSADKYTYYNTVALLYSSFDNNKAYELYSKAEKYELDVPWIDRKISHYRNKSLVAPNYFLSLAALDKALDLFKKNQIADSLIYANLMYDYGRLYDEMNDYEKASFAYTKAMNIDCRNNQGLGLDVSSSDKLFEVMLFVTSFGGYDPKWIEGLEWSLNARKTFQREDHPDFINAKYSMVEIYIRTNLLEKADSLLCILEADSVTKEYRKNNLYFRGRYYYVVGNKEQAKSCFEKFLKQYPEDQNINVFNYLMDIYHDEGNRQKLSEVMEWYIQTWRKMLEYKWYYLTDKERGNYLHTLEIETKNIIKYADAYETVEKALNTALFCKGLLLNTTKFISNELYKLKKDNIHNLPVLEDSLMRSLAYDNISIKKVSRTLNVTVEQIKKKLRKDEIAIDFVMADSLVAFVLSNNRPVCCIHLPNMPLENLSAFTEVLSPLTDYIKSAKRVYFSPIDCLCKYAIENVLAKDFPEVEFRRVFHLGQIKESERMIFNSIVAIGNPRFNDELTEANPLRGVVLSPLPGTGVEIDSLQRSLSVIRNIKIKTFTGNEASEANFKALDGQHVDLLHFATHGFFNEDMNKSGLLLTGANRGLNEEYIPQDKDDGILTTEEIENMHFPNLQLVVLSACETGLGATNIDGVWGLQRAFRIAGAKNMIVSLNKVDDEATQAFMIDFYRNLASGMSIYHSFRNAQANADEETKNSFILIE